ncbi:lytic transglycosylase domain-containing protein [Candidatus Pantoea multigeneris]|uniref:Transglycosylase SLT domain-containing protein n=1 Tax=Candidatus Pantoea multigeneris TaxID=2608357 RepID=A0ABX0R4C6_9GAMM|nr:transglycosylase SLT domain-containing protein [Pantoea multigeneris]NIF20258.1 transglycosylase SLT domain-containing protein [Pantoea multigeneris]
MNADTIKDFMISLGFQVDGAGAKKFESVILGATLNVVKLGSAVEATALSVVAFTAKIASGLDNLYWAGQRSGATVAGIQALGYAASQTGSSVEAARSSLEGLARFVRNSPGAEGFLNRLGVQTRDASGRMRDMSSIFSGVGQQLSKMPYYRANQYAQMLGIDENTLMAMRRGMGQFSGQYTQMAQAIGYNADAAAVSSNKFMTSLRSFGQMAGMARDKIGSSLANGLSGSIDNLRKQIIDNFPKIEQTITAGVKGILWLADAISRLVYRLFEAAQDIQTWWRGLDSSTQKLIATVGGLVVAWRILNSAFLASPLGIVTLLIGSLALLYDDYKTWKEGGKSLIDWSTWEPGINAAKGALDWFTDKLNKLNNGTLDWKATLKSLSDFMKGDWSQVINEAINYVNSKFNGFFSDFGKKLANSPFWHLLEKAHIMSAKDTTDMLSLFNGTPDTPDQHAQSVKRPQPTQAGAALLGWMQPKFAQLEALYHLPVGVLRGMAITESGGNQFAVGPKTKYGQAKGMFQLIDGTARDLGLRGNDVFDPAKSAEAAARYLSQLLKANGGNLSKALASYNWGLGNVQRYGMGLMPRETREYLPKVLSNMPGATGGASISQETNIHIHGVNDPRQAAQAIADKQTSVNARLAQSATTGPR